jgi:hypothetical protein
VIVFSTEQNEILSGFSKPRKKVVNVGKLLSQMQRCIPTKIHTLLGQGNRCQNTQSPLYTHTNIYPVVGLCCTPA